MFLFALGLEVISATRFSLSLFRGKFTMGDRNDPRFYRRETLEALEIGIGRRGGCTWKLHYKALDLGFRVSGIPRFFAGKSRRRASLAGNHTLNSNQSSKHLPFKLQRPTRSFFSASSDFLLAPSASFSTPILFYLSSTVGVAGRPVPLRHRSFSSLPTCRLLFLASWPRKLET